MTVALLVIDIQCGAFDGVRCPPIDRAEELVANARTLIDASRSSARPVVFVQHCDGPGESFEEGTPHWEIHGRLAPLPDEFVVRKRASSAFVDTDLADGLRERGVTALVVCGLQSDFCVTNTSKAALAAGYAVTIAEDGHSTWPSHGRTSAEIVAHVNRELQSIGATIESTARVAERLRVRG